MSDTKTPVPEQSSFTLLTAKELSEKLRLPTSWIRTHSAISTPKEARIPAVRFGKYVRFRWGSPELEAWLKGREWK
jgi:hypothetical protein